MSFKRNFALGAGIVGIGYVGLKNLEAYITRSLAIEYQLDKESIHNKNIRAFRDYERRHYEGLLRTPGRVLAEVLR